MSTEMTGEQEVHWGDPDATGTAHITINRGQGELCFELHVTKMAPATAAHIHRAPVGEAGVIVVHLTAPYPESSAGCRSVDRALLEDIQDNPWNYYVNVHNSEFPAGAVRGQLG